MLTPDSFLEYLCHKEAVGVLPSIPLVEIGNPMTRQPAKGKSSICNDSFVSPQLSVFQEVQSCSMEINRVARRHEPLEPIDPFSLMPTWKLAFLLRLSQNLFSNDTNKGFLLTLSLARSFQTTKISSLLPFKAGSNYKR